MCGISGFLEAGGGRGRAGRDGLEAVAVTMADTMRHRGPDDAGTWTDEQVGVGLGFRRLAIIDLTPTGHQPMVSRSGRLVVVFNGEIYNYGDIRDELLAAGVTFRGTSDTEVLVEAIDRWGLAETLGRVDGMFAAAVWDRERQRLSLTRDRMGEKPLYYGWQGSTFVFGSELKAVLAHPAVRPEIDRDALTLLLRFGYIPVPWTIYRGVAKLPPGTIVEVDPTSQGTAPRPTSYWSFEEVARRGVTDPLDVTPAEAADAVHDVLASSVRRRMVADVPVGAFLSGGIDSSAIVSLMQATGTTAARTFTIGFKEAGFDEAAAARAVAAHLGTEHTELYVTPAEAMEVIPSLPHAFDEPFADVSQIPTMLVARLARRDVTVALAGDGGDELFGGYARYFVHHRLWRATSLLPARARPGLARALRTPSVATWDRAARAVGPLAPRALRQAQVGDKVHKLARVVGASDPLEMYAGLQAVWPDAASAVLGSANPRTLLDDRSAWRPPGLTHEAMYLDTRTYLPDDILVKTDRATMAASLEGRLPLLDHRLVELAWRLPVNVKVRGGVGKAVLRDVLDRYVPRELVDRPKMGFGVPIGDWLRGPLRDWAEDLLAEPVLRGDGFLEPTIVRQRWSEHLTGARDWKYQLWAVLMFQAWRQEGGAGQTGRAGAADDEGIQ